MKFLEVIELRSITENRSSLREKVNSILAETETIEKDYEIKIYYRNNINTDFCIQILIELNEENTEESEIGFQLTSELKKYGLVNHSLWLEDK